MIVIVWLIGAIQHSTHSIVHSLKIMECVRELNSSNTNLPMLEDCNLVCQNSIFIQLREYV